MELLIGENTPRRGNRFSRGVLRRLFRWAGWRIEGKLPDLSHFVIIAAPHSTYLRDFFIAMVVIHGLGIDLKWMGKHSIFWFPLSVLLKWWGGVPVDRRAPRGYVGQMVDEFASRDGFILALAPEGTRWNMDNWKSGFYHIARAADVPVVPVVADYEHKKVIILPPFQTTSDKDADMAYLRSLYGE